MHDLISIFWFFLPAGAANMAPIIFNRLPLLNIPVDFNKKFRGRQIFGPHKTYRGFAVGIPLAMAVTFSQKLLYPHLQSYSLVDYSSVNIIWLGFLLGFGALAGDLIKSFAKRRLGIAPGSSWVPFDQVDWVIGAMVLSSLVVDFDFRNMVIALAIFGLLHPISNMAGYYLKLKPNKF